MISGTDSPIDHTAVSTHLNLRAMVRYGVTPHQAMVAATSEPGRFLEEPLGRIEQGMHADLTLLGGNPLDDIEQAANVEQVMVSRVAYTVDELLEPFAASASTKRADVPPNRTLSPVPEHSSNRKYWWHDEHYVEEARRRHSCCTQE